jgi:flagellar hook-length control protein FliK
MARRLQPCCGLFASNEVSPVPSVASEVPVQPSKRPEPPTGRLGPPARTPSTPFDRVLDAAANPPPAPRRADRPERAPASDQPAHAKADAPAPAESKDGQPSDPSPCAPSKAAASAETGDLPPASDQPLPEAAPAQPAEMAVPIVTAATDKDGDAAATEGTDPTAAPDDAKSADTKSADTKSADAAAVITTAAAAAAIAPNPAVAVAVIAVPVVPAVAADPGTPSADDKIEPASQPITLAPNAGVEPAHVQSAQAPIAADAAAVKAGAPKEEETPAQTASVGVAKIAKPAQSDAAAEITTTVRPDEKADKPKGERGRSERAGASMRPAPAPAPHSPDADAPDAPDKPAVPAVHAHAQAADRMAAVARPTFSEARDSTLTNAMPAQVSTALPAVNAAASAFALPTLAPITALRVDTAPDVAVPLAGLAVEIVSRAQEGLKRFEIRLDPPDLGRIDVRLDVDHDGRVTSRLIVERADTLDLLRRDAPALERALQQAGLKTDGGIDFSLRDQSHSFRDQAPRDGSPTTRLIIPDDELPASEAVRGYGRLIGLGGGIDIRV